MPWYDFGFGPNTHEELELVGMSRRVTDKYMETCRIVGTTPDAPGLAMAMLQDYVQQGGPPQMAAFVVTLPNDPAGMLFCARLCDMHLPSCVRNIVPSQASGVDVAPLNASAGFPCDYCQEGQ